ALNCALAERLGGMAEVFGVGAFDIAALAVGGYGAVLARVDEEPSAAEPPAAPLLEYLVEQLIECAGGECALDPERLDALLPPGEPPPSFELLLTPCAPAPGEAPGTGWLLGLHAPTASPCGRAPCTGCDRRRCPAASTGCSPAGRWCASTPPGR